MCVNVFGFFYKGVCFVCGLKCVNVCGFFYKGVCFVCGLKCVCVCLDFSIKVFVLFVV